MIRKIICLKCRASFPLQPFPEDIAAGWKRRIVAGIAQRPPDLEIRIHAGGTVERFPVTTLVCDFCNDEIKDGNRAVAVTDWRPAKEEEPGYWEAEYLPGGVES